MKRYRVLAGVVSALALAIGYGCVGDTSNANIFQNDGGSGGDSSSNADGGTGGGQDATLDGTTGGGNDGASTAEGGGGGSDGGVDAAPIYQDINTLGNWSHTTVTLNAVSANGLLGAAFDGRFIYWPQGGSTTTFFSFDTKAPTGFTGLASYRSFDISTLTGSAGAVGYRGAVHFGQDVYFTPGNNNAPHGKFVKYDAMNGGADGGPGGFDTAANWTIYDVGAAFAGNGVANVYGYVGGTHDSSYVYFAPYETTAAAPHGKALKFDPAGGFSTFGSWSLFDTTGLDANAKGFRGAIFDGKYVYYVPGQEGPAVVVRYDTGKAFTNSASWEKFAIANVDSNATAFGCAIFDGRFIYFIPAGDPGVYKGVIARFDTMAASLSTVTAWETFDIAAFSQPQDAGNGSGYFSAGFDGRYIWATPYSSSSHFARYDTTGGAFQDAAAWNTFDNRLVNGAIVFGGTVFDGEYLYFSPGQGPNQFLRFHARAPAGPITPPLYEGSSF
jgi:hypothetical protein